jgi:hypothetical protein
MIHITDVYALKAKVEKLKRKLNTEEISDYEKTITHRYLNDVLDYIDELRLH